MENVNGVCWVIGKGDGFSTCGWALNPARVREVPVMDAMLDGETLPDVTARSVLCST